MAPPKEVPEDARESGAVYFCYEHAADSFSGILVEEYTLSNEELRDYIRYDNPKLFKRLKGLPFASSDVPMSYHAQRRFKETHKIQQEMDAERSTKQTPKEHAYETSESTPQDTNTPIFQVDNGLLELQLKRYVQMSLLSMFD